MSGRGQMGKVGIPSLALRHPLPCGGLIHEHRMDAMWYGWISGGSNSAQTTNRGTFGAKRRRGFGGYGPQCMKCHNRKKAARWLPFCDSVGIRTQDPQLRRLLLYPAELRNQTPIKGSAKLDNISEYPTERSWQSNRGRGRW